MVSEENARCTSNESGCGCTEMDDTAAKASVLQTALQTRDSAQRIIDRLRSELGLTVPTVCTALERLIITEQPDGSARLDCWTSDGHGVVILQPHVWADLKFAVLCATPHARDEGPAYRRGVMAGKRQAKGR